MTSIHVLPPSVEVRCQDMVLVPVLTSAPWETRNELCTNPNNCFMTFAHDIHNFHNKCIHNNSGLHDTVHIAHDIHNFHSKCIHKNSGLHDTIHIAHDIHNFHMHEFHKNSRLHDTVHSTHDIHNFHSIYAFTKAVHYMTQYILHITYIHNLHSLHSQKR